jgi:hypothetical protein
MSRLEYLGHVLMENRNGLIVDAMLTHAGPLIIDRALEGNELR